MGFGKEAAEYRDCTLNNFRQLIEWTNGNVPGASLHNLLPPSSSFLKHFWRTF